MESRQNGHRDGPDVIGRFSVSKGTRFRCSRAEIYDENNEEPFLACVIRFDDDSSFRLTVGQSMQSSENGEAELQCAGTKPRLCQVMVRRESKPSR